MKRLVLIMLFLPSTAWSQAWSNILSSSRAIDWTHAGLPPSYPDGETTPNPWTPPTRTQCGATLTASGNATTDTTNITNALSACTAGHYVLLGPGSFQYNSALFLLTSGVTLRGSGPMSTSLTATGGGNNFIDLGAATGSQTCTWSSGLSTGSTSLGLTGCTGTPSVNTLLFLSQCDSGYSGATCTIGTATDNGGLYICGDVTPCIRAGEGTGEPNHQTQVEWITAVTPTGGSNYTVTVSTPIYMPNWNAANTPVASWVATTYYGIGIEDMTIRTDPASTTSQFGFFANFDYGGWIKGVRFIGTGQTGPLHINSNKNFLMMSNYIHSQIALLGTYPVASQDTGDSDCLFLNNVMDGSVGYEALGASSGNIFAYNYPIWVFTNQETTPIMDHAAGNAFKLYEGNISGGNTEDDTHGTHDLSTSFRNYYSGWYQPYTTHPSKNIFNWGAGNRFTNVVGNILGSSFMTIYQEAITCNFGFIYGYDTCSSVVSDPLVQATNLRWANYDTITAATRYCGNSSSPGWATTCASTSEIPTTLTGNAAFGNNLIPSTTNLPCSFFLQGFTATTCSPFPSGGTGLNWWKVCVSWTTFPTACAITQMSPFPPIGPDVTGGNAPASSFGSSPGIAGHAFDIPAAIAFLNLPIDLTLQSSYSITSSSWSGGIETLNISPAFTDSTHVIGGLQISGGACATAGAGTSTGAEVFIVDSTTTSVKYALASNPGACTGSILFPDIRQFDERVYMNDPAGIPQASTPRFSLAAGTYLTSQSVTITTISVGAIICYNTTGSPATNGSTGCSTGTLYTGPVTVSASEHLYAVAGGTGYTDSTIASISYAIGPTQIMPQIFAGNSMTSGSATVTGN